MKRTTVTILAAVTVLVALSGSVQARATIAVEYTFGTPPSGINNTFTIDCKLSTPVDNFSGYDISFFYDSSKVEYVSMLDLSGTGEGGGEVENLGGGGFAGCNRSVDTFRCGNDETPSNVTSLYTMTFKQLTAAAPTSWGATDWSPPSGNLGLWSIENSFSGEAVAIPHTFDVSAIPEPATMSLLAVGGIATLIRRRRRA